MGRRRDPKQTGVHTGAVQPRQFDVCQTPPYALDPLLPYLPKSSTIWEPACGEGILAKALADAGHAVHGSDILPLPNYRTPNLVIQGNRDFIQGKPLVEAHPYIIVTNPPFSDKYRWLDRCYSLGVPFALLLPVETLGTKHAQAQFEMHGVEIILLNRRVDFKMPHKAWGGKGAHFAVAWFTWGLGIGSTLTYGRITKTALGQGALELEAVA